MKTYKQRLVFLYIFVMCILLQQSAIAQVIDWEPIDAAYRYDVCRMAHNGTVLFAGTNTKGVLRSFDAGKTWEVANTGLNIDKQQLQIIEMLSMNGWVFIATSRGIYRTNNDGASWSLSGSPLSISSMVTNGKAIFIGAATNGASDGIYRSTNNGDSWQLVKSKVFTVYLADGDSVWIEDENSNTKKISISADGGNTWKSIQPVGNKLVRPKFFKNGPTLYMTDIYILSYGGLLRSDDGGATWTPVEAASYGAKSVFVFDGWLFAGSYRSKDNGVTWESTNKNIGIYATAIGKTIFFGENNMYRSTDYIKSATKIKCYNPIYSMIVSKKAGLHICTDNGYIVDVVIGYGWRGINDNKEHSYYSIVQKGSTIYVGTNDGVYSFPDTIDVYVDYTKTDLSDTIYSIGVNGTTMYAGTRSGIYRQKDGSSTWEKQTQVGNSPVRAIVINNGTIVAGTDNGIYISTNDGQTWTQKNSGLTTTKIQSLFIEGNRILAGTPQGVYLSTNAGTSWTAINTGLSNTNVHCVAILYGKFLAGTDAGVFVSKDKGNSWHQNPTDLVKSVVNTFLIYEHSPVETRLVAGTQMQGAFYIYNFEEFSSVDEQPIVNIPEVHLSPNPASDHITVELDNESTDCTITLYDLYGSSVGNYSIVGRQSIINTDQLSSGVYTLRVQYGNRTASKTVAIIK